MFEKIYGNLIDILGKGKEDGVAELDSSGKVPLTQLPEIDVSNKQDKLTAGENIDITNNVISATGASSSGSTRNGGLYNAVNTSTQSEVKIQLLTAVMEGWAEIRSEEMNSNYAGYEITKEKDSHVMADYNHHSSYQLDENFPVFSTGSASNGNKSALISFRLSPYLLRRYNQGMNIKQLFLEFIPLNSTWGIDAKDLKVLIRRNGVELTNLAKPEVYTRWNVSGATLREYGGNITVWGMPTNSLSIMDLSEIEICIQHTGNDNPCRFLRPSLRFTI